MLSLTQSLFIISPSFRRADRPDIPVSKTCIDGRLAHRDTAPECDVILDLGRS